MIESYIVWYGVDTISRLLKITGLFCKRALQKRRYSAKQTYNFREPTDRSHPIREIHRLNLCLLRMRYFRSIHRTASHGPRNESCLYPMSHVVHAWVMSLMHESCPYKWDDRESTSYRVSWPSQWVMSLMNHFRSLRHERVRSLINEIYQEYTSYRVSWPSPSTQRSTFAFTICIQVCCRVVQCVTECCRAFQSAAVRCSVSRCVAVCCSVLPCLAVCCSVLLSSYVFKRFCCGVHDHVLSWKSKYICVYV